MTILDEIVENKRFEIASRKRELRPSDLRDMEFFSRSTSSLKTGLDSGPVVAIIAEIKRSSPSAGVLRREVDTGELARSYDKYGASGISVLTDDRFFSGSLHDLASVRSVTPLPLLRKDFIIDEYQILEARAYGADAVLLIAAILDRQHLHELFLASTELGLDCLVELYEESEIDKLALDKMTLIGVNNRNLHTFEIDINRTATIAKQLPAGITLVSESGIRTSDDLKRLREGGARAALIGEQFMKSPDPGEALQKLLDGVEA